MPLLDPPRRFRILAIDDEPANLKLLNALLRDDYSLSFASCGVDGLIAAHKHHPDLILLDIMMPEMDGYEVLRRLRSDPQTSGTPVIFVTARRDQEGEEEGFDAGAVDYISKPIKPRLLQARVRTHLALADQRNSYRQQVFEATQDLKKSYHEAIHMLGTAGHFNDQDTGLHIWRMGAFAGAIARAKLWPVERAAMLELAAAMHDMGKVGIPDQILRKPGKLTEEEWRTMKRHSALGHQILNKATSPVFKLAAEVALHHHERWDGTGYPAGLAGNAIPESARIVAIADVFDALTMVRPYKVAWPVDKAFDEISRSAGTHLDPNLVEIFLSVRGEILMLKERWDSREAAA